MTAFAASRWVGLLSITSSLSLMSSVSAFAQATPVQPSNGQSAAAAAAQPGNRAAKVPATKGTSSAVTKGAPASANPSEDVVVTANRREQPAQKVGVSLTALSGATLGRNNIQSAEELERLVPGVNATTSTGAGVATFVIRGVGESDVSDHEEQPNAAYTDGVYSPFATAASIPLFDLQRVEVLRGPQGTLFGRNATGGAIQYISAPPLPGFSGAIEAATGSRDLYRLQGVLDLGNDRVANRFSFYYQTQQGFIDNVLGANRGNSEVFAYRDQLRYTPSDATTVTVRFQGFNETRTAPGYISTPAYTNSAGVDVLLPPNVNAYGVPGGDFYGYRNPYPVSDLKVALNDPGADNNATDTLSATVDYQLNGNNKFTSVTAAAYDRAVYREDTDSTPINEFEAGVQSRAFDAQQEFRLTGSTGRFHYTAGVYFLYIDGDYSNYNIVPVFEGPGDIPHQDTENNYQVRTVSEAVYSQGEYQISKQVTFILGARYSADQERLHLNDHCYEDAIGACGSGDLGPSGDSVFPIIGIPSVNGYRESTSDGDWSGKIELNYQPYNNLLLYTSLNKGFKAGGFTAPVGAEIPPGGVAYAPEQLYDGEIGEKAQFFNKRLTINTTGYYYDYHNNQNFLFDGIIATVIDKDATAYGYDVEVNARPLPTVTLFANAEYNHFLVRDVNGAPNGEGQRPNLAPRTAFNWGASKFFNLGHAFGLTLGYTGRYVGQTYYNLLNIPLDRAPPYALANFWLRVDAPRSWYLQFNVDNAFSRLNQVGAFDVVYAGFALRQYGEPLTITAAIGTRF